MTPYLGEKRAVFLGLRVLGVGGCLVVGRLSVGRCVRVLFCGRHGWSSRLDSCGIGCAAILLGRPGRARVVDLDRLAHEGFPQLVIGGQTVDQRERIDLQADRDDERAGERDRARGRREPLRRAIHRLVEPVVDLGDEVAFSLLKDRDVLPDHVRDLPGSSVRGEAPPSGSP